MHKTRAQHMFLVAGSIGAGLLLLMSLNFSTFAQEGNSIPGFSELRWGMSQQEAAEVFQQAEDFLVPSDRVGRGGEYGDTQWIGVLVGGGNYTYDGRPCKSIVLYMNQDDELTAFSCAYASKRPAEFLQITKSYDERCEEIEDSRRTEDELVHYAWQCGNMTLELIEYKASPGVLSFQGQLKQ